jgi:hypothetical protein
MTRETVKRRTAWLDVSPRLSPEMPEAVPAPISIHTSLQDCSMNRIDQRPSRGHNVPSQTAWVRPPRGQQPTVVERTTVWLRRQYSSWAAKQVQSAQKVSLVKNVNSSRDTKVNLPRRSSAGPMSQIFSWVRSRYSLSSTKRLRVGEIASLGEKRFVALVTVEGREFLIGGGAAGVSLLTPLGSAPQPAAPIQAQLDFRGNAE